MPINRESTQSTTYRYRCFDQLILITLKAPKKSNYETDTLPFNTSFFYDLKFWAKEKN